MNHFKYFFNAHLRGINLDCIISRPQWRNAAIHIPIIPRNNLIEKTRQISSFALFEQLPMTPTCTLFGTGGQIDLQFGVGKNHGAHITAISNQTWRLAKGALTLQQSGPHSRYSRNL